MTQLFLALHVLLAVALIGIVLLQRSEGGGLGIGGGMSGFMTGRSSANLLTRVTAALAALFFATSLVLAILAGTPESAGSVPRRPYRGAGDGPAGARLSPRARRRPNPPHRPRNPALRLRLRPFRRGSRERSRTDRGRRGARPPGRQS